MHFPSRDFAISLVVCVVVGIPAFLLEGHYTINFGKDWIEAFHPATEALLHGLNPYAVGIFHNPVWVLLPLIPFALLGAKWGGTVLFFVNLFSFSFVALRFRARPGALLMLVLCPLVLYSLFLNNIDWLVLWGFIMPAPIGLFFVLAKPQIGVAVAIYWGIAAWKEGGYRKLLITFLPCAIAFAATFLLFGNWMADRTDHLVSGAPWNVSLFPWSSIVGAVLLAIAVRAKKVTPAIAASPFLSPYIGLGSWSVIGFALLEHRLPMFAFFVGTWVLFLGNALAILAR